MTFLAVTARSEVYLVDPLGDIEMVDWRAQSRWEWRGISPSRQIIPGFNLEEEPVYVTEVDVPRTTSLDLDAAKGMRRGVSEDEEHFKRWTIESRGYPPSAEVKVKRAGKSMKRDLLVLSAPLSELFILHESCKDLGISWGKTKSNKIKNFEGYLGAYCKDNGFSILVAFISPSGSHLVSRWSMSAKKIPASKDFIVYEVQKSDEPADKLQSFGKATITMPSKGASAESSLFLSQLKAYRRWSMNVGASLTYLQYKEDPLGITANGFAVSAKGGFHYHLIPKKIEIDAAAYVNLMPFAYSLTNGAKAPRFWGLNLRAGYVLPPFDNGWQLKILAGPYVWGMLVPGKTYGVASLIGGQVFANLDIPRNMWMKTSAYFKIAPVGQDFSNLATFKNYEIALGAGHDLGNVFLGMPMRLLLDISYFKVGELNNAANTITLNTFSLGAGLRF